LRKGVGQRILVELSTNKKFQINSDQIVKNALPAQRLQPSHKQKTDDDASDSFDEFQNKQIQGQLFSVSYEGIEEDNEAARKNERVNPAQKAASRLPVNSRFQKPNYVQEIRRKADAQLYDSFDS